jgi:Polyketide cyclase / dehydrase and lipid transport
LTRFPGHLALVLTMLGSVNAKAVTVEALDITHEGNSYSVAFAVAVAADPVEVSKTLADYALWPKLSNIIIESRRLDVLPSGIERIGVTFHTCLFGAVFCRTIRQVKDLDRLPDGRSFVTTMVPEQSDFLSGSERWEVRGDGKDTTRLTYTASLVLGFRVPPVIGPWLLKRELRRELIATADKLEALAAH